MSRPERHTLIAELLASGPISSQEELRLLLAERGIEVTQATLSRDLRELGVVKGPAGYVLLGPVGRSSGASSGGTARPVSPIAGALDRVLGDYSRSAAQAGNLVVLKTGAGHAQVVAIELDRRPPQGVVGTVAGDDTIFVACVDAETAAALVERVRLIAGLGL